MPIATVVGLNGTVVTLTWTTASNAALAQQALKNITNGVGSGAMQEVEYLGGSTLPALGNATVQGVVLAEGAGTSAHAPIQLGGQYQIGISNDTSASPAAQAWVVPFTAGTGASPQDTVFVGGGGGDVANFGANTQLYYTGQGSAPQSLEEIGLLGATTPSANAWVDGNLTVDGSVGSTTIHLDTAPGAGFASTIRIVNNLTGNNVVDIASNATTVTPLKDVIVLSGNAQQTGTPPPAHINLGGSAAVGTVPATDPQAEMVLFNVNQGSAIIDPGAAKWIIVGVGAAGGDTVFGGSSSGNVDAGATGSIMGGSGGGNLLFGSVIPGSTTLISGGNNDIMASLAKGTVMEAGPGNETLASFAAGTVFEGFLGVSSLASPNFTAEVGGNTFGIGKGSTDIVANSTGDNFYQESIPGNGADSTTINGFSVGTDTISLANPKTGGGRRAAAPTPRLPVAALASTRSASRWPAATRRCSSATAASGRSLASPLRSPSSNPLPSRKPPPRQRGGGFSLLRRALPRRVLVSVGAPGPECVQVRAAFRCGPAVPRAGGPAAGASHGVRVPTSSPRRAGRRSRG